MKRQLLFAVIKRKKIRVKIKVMHLTKKYNTLLTNNVKYDKIIVICVYRRMQ